MNSLDYKISRYVGGGTTETSNNMVEWWEKTVFDFDFSDTEYSVEKYYEGRLDLISFVFLGEPRYWWVIAQLNNILDPFSEIVEGRVLRIPSKERLGLMLNKKLGGVESKREPVSTISPIIT